MKQAVAYLLPFMEEDKRRHGVAEGNIPRILLATVKGDVHDIGKNIVGVVLQCNNYDVVDLGVMVPAQKILDTVKAEKADIVGLSGLITPSLDEMVNFAEEMERQGLEIPLLIGGATTSRAHTAVKVNPKYHGPVVWVKDASRSVPTAAALLSDERRPVLMAEVEKDYEALRRRHAAKKTDRPLLTFPDAIAARSPIDWSDYHPPRPRFLLQQARDVCEGPTCDHQHGKVTSYTKVFKDYPLAELREFIDWGPFFNAWEMKGRFPDILNNPATGEAARRLYDDGQALLDQMIEQKWATANAVIGLFPANAVGEDVEVYTDESRTEVLTTVHHLRQQGEHRPGIPNRSLTDFIAPKETGLPDYIGGFAVTAGLGIEQKIMEFKANLDDYSAILLESLADRLAEAFAERLHQRVRKEFWGFAGDEDLGNDDLIAEKYRGIRPAPGYPACPDHTEKALLWDLLDVQAQTGIELTDSMAMWPGAAVSGWYFSHPESRYFVVGRIDKDQVTDYAQRKGWTMKEAERWLSPNLGYDSDD
jgi:5-methyltetrahydrofolate--homocysteine methyltransferase